MSADRDRLCLQPPTPRPPGVSCFSHFGRLVWLSALWPVKPDRSVSRSGPILFHFLVLTPASGKTVVRLPLTLKKDVVLLFGLVWSTMPNERPGLLISHSDPWEVI